jgi:hypothetical protein
LSNLGVGLRGHIAGLTLANNASDATNDLDIAAGEARDDTNVDTIALSSGLTKQLDAAWASGNAAGMRDTGSISDATWHIFLIKDTTSGAVDILASLSATAPTMPAGYTLKRRIGSIIRASGAIRSFRQTGDLFEASPAVERNSTAAYAEALFTLLYVPTGIRIRPILGISLDVSVGAATFAFGSAAAGSAQHTVAYVNTNEHIRATLPTIFMTNTSAQVYFRQNNISGTPDVAAFSSCGWIDTRGRDD